MSLYGLTLRDLILHGGREAKVVILPQAAVRSTESIVAT
jgi:hypothetical protein